MKQEEISLILTDESDNLLVKVRQLLVDEKASYIALQVVLATIIRSTVGHLNTLQDELGSRWQDVLLFSLLSEDQAKIVSMKEE